MRFDETTSRRVEATYRTPDVVEQRRVILAALGLRPGADVLDIGSGPGFLACEMAETIGPGGSVRGIDASDAMLAAARQRQPRPGSAPVEFGPGQATELPFGEGEFDVVTSTCSSPPGSGRVQAESSNATSTPIAAHNTTARQGAYRENPIAILALMRMMPCRAGRDPGG
jgi:SAM-dependent methyltransferase